MGELKIAYSDKKVTPWGGMKLLKNFIDLLEIFSYLKQLNIPKPNSNAGYDPNILILGFWLSIFTGGNRFSHTDWLRYDATLQSIFELEKLPSSSRPPLHKGTKCDIRFKSSLNSARLNLLNPYK